MTTFRRRLLGLAALIAILAILVGLPAVLIAVGANPFGDGFPSWSDLTRPDDGALALAAIKVVAWIAWAALAVALLAEIAARLRGVRAPRLPGLRLPQSAARGLVGAAFALFASTIPVAAASSMPASAAPIATVQLVDSAASSGGPVDTDAQAVAAVEPTNPAEPVATIQYTVQPHDSLWSIAEKLLGDGRRYTEIVELNQEVLDGKADFIRAGWVLAVPAPAPEPTTDAGGSDTVVVAPGDTLSEIATARLGDPQRYGEIYDASRDTVQPDGQTLTDPDLIKPGWLLTVPDEDPVVEPVVQPAKPTAVEPGSPRSNAPSVVEPDETAPPTVPSAVEPAEPSMVGPGEITPPVDDAGASADDEADDTDADLGDDPSWHVVTGAGVSSILAATVIGVVAKRRHTQHRTRKAGQKVPLPDGEAAVLEQDLRAGADEAAIAAIDTALRSLARACRATGQSLPPVRAASLSSDALHLYLEDPAALPAPWRDEAGAGLVWTLSNPGALPAPSVDAGPAPYPSLVTIGNDESDAHLLLNLEQLGALGIVGDEEDTRAVVAALAIELATSTWADDLQVTVVGWFAELEGILRSGQIRYVPTIGKLLDRLQERANSDRQALAAAGARDLNAARVTDVAPEAWTPEIILVADFLTDPQKARLTALAAELPHVAFAAVAAGGGAGEWNVRLEPGAQHAVLEPIGLAFAPQRITLAQYDDILRVVALTDPAEMVGDGEAAPTLADVAGRAPVEELEPAPAPAVLAATGPRLLMLGPVDLVGAAGTVEASKRARLLELATYLALNPNAPFPAIDDAIWPDRSTEDNLNTRNTATSKLRRWLGQDESGEDYLPRHQAGAGYGFGPAVTSDVDDWNRLLAGDPLNASTESLEAALALVRGIPFEGTHRRRYAWAEPVRQRLTSEIVDVSYALAKRRLMEGRWRAAEGAVVVGLRVDPAQEALWRLRILAAYESRNPEAVAEAVDRLLAITERLEVDLEPETEELLAAIKRPDTDAGRALGLHAL